ncbi:MAG: hypothetical protein AAB401_13595 [Acidobacteriota bacterium]
MKLARLIALLLFATAVSVSAEAQITDAAIAENKLPVEIVKHKIGVDYYPMLDRPGLMSAESGDMPMTEVECLARQSNRNNKRSAAPIAPEEDRRARGRLRSYTRVLDDAQMVEVVVKNTEAKPIKRVDWDFAFLRYENGQPLARYNVTTQIKIKPGGKKTLKHKLPPGAKRCEVVRVVSDENLPNKVNPYEAVCGAFFYDPSLLNHKQETITIKRIEYVDGTVWQRP